MHKRVSINERIYRICSGIVQIAMGASVYDAADSTSMSIYPRLKDAANQYLCRQAGRWRVRTLIAFGIVATCGIILGVHGAFAHWTETEQSLLFAVPLCGPTLILTAALGITTGRGRETVTPHQWNQARVYALGLLPATDLLRGPFQQFADIWFSSQGIDAGLYRVFCETDTAARTANEVATAALLVAA